MEPMFPLHIDAFEDHTGCIQVQGKYIWVHPKVIRM